MKKSAFQRKNKTSIAVPSKNAASELLGGKNVGVPLVGVAFTVEGNQEKGRVRSEKTYRKGMTENKLNSDWKACPEFDNMNAHGICLSVPFNGSLSKNNMHRSKWGGLYWTTETRIEREAITMQIKNMGHVFYLGKVWLSLLIERPDHSGDSINFLDVIADAVKDAIGVDDRWFSVKSIDWMIVKEKPRIHIWVLQDITEHHQLCSSCGQIRPLTDFVESIQRKTLERGRVGTKYCLSCRTHKTEVKKVIKKCVDCGVIKDTKSARTSQRCFECHKNNYVASRKRLKGRFLSEDGKGQVRVLITPPNW